MPFRSSSSWQDGQSWCKTSWYVRSAPASRPCGGSVPGPACRGRVRVCARRALTGARRGRFPRWWFQGLRSWVPFGGSGSGEWMSQHYTHVVSLVNMCCYFLFGSRRKPLGPKDLEAPSIVHIFCDTPSWGGIWQRTQLQAAKGVVNSASTSGADRKKTVRGKNPWAGIVLAGHHAREGTGVWRTRDRFSGLSRGAGVRAVLEHGCPGGPRPASPQPHPPPPRPPPEAAGGEGEAANRGQNNVRHVQPAVNGRA
jgi:hypothetical protein